MCYPASRGNYVKKEKEAGYVRKEAAELVCTITCAFSLTCRASAMEEGACCSYAAILSLDR
jgi:hypothetical protein